MGEPLSLPRVHGRTVHRRRTWLDLLAAALSHRPLPGNHIDPSAKATLIRLLRARTHLDQCGVLNEATLIQAD